MFLHFELDEDVSMLTKEEHRAYLIALKEFEEALIGAPLFFTDEAFEEVDVEYIYEQFYEKGQRR